MHRLVPVLAALLLLLVCAAPDALPAAGFMWDWLNGVGICAVAALCALHLDADKPAMAARMAGHRNLAMVCAALACVHAFGLLIADPIVFEYLKPTAPAYMLVGAVGFIALVALTVTSIGAARHRVYASFRHFGHWHTGLAIAVVIMSAWHVLGTGFAIRGGWSVAAFVAITAGVPIYAYVRRRQNKKDPRRSSDPGGTGTAPLAASSFLLFLLLAAAYAGFKNF